MRSYWEQLRASGRDVQLFMVYALISWLGIGTSSLIFNLYLVRLGYDEGFIGAYNATLTLSMGIACLGIGYLINRFGNWWCILLGTLWFTVSMVGLSLVSTSWLLLSLAVLNGIGMAVIVTNQMPFIMEWVPRQHTTSIMAVAASLNSASVMLGSLLGGFLPGIVAASLGTVGTDSIAAFRITLLASCALNGLGLVPMLMMKTVRQQRHQSDFQIAHAQIPSHRVRHQARRDLIAVTLLGLLLALGCGAIEPFYNVLLQNKGTSTGTIGIIFAVGSLLAVVASLGAPPIAKRVGNVLSMTIIRLFHVPIHLALIWFPSAAVVSMAYTSRRVSGSMAWPLESSHFGGLLPPNARAHAFGMRSAAWNIGFAFAAFMSGQAIARTGSYKPAYVAIAVFCILSALVYIVAFGNRTTYEDAQAAAGEIDPTPALEPATD